MGLRNYFSFLIILFALAAVSCAREREKSPNDEELQSQIREEILSEGTVDFKKYERILSERKAGCEEVRCLNLNENVSEALTEVALTGNAFDRRVALQGLENYIEQNSESVSLPDELQLFTVKLQLENSLELPPREHRSPIFERHLQQKIMQSFRLDAVDSKTLAILKSAAVPETGDWAQIKLQAHALTEAKVQEAVRAEFKKISKRKLIRDLVFGHVKTNEYARGAFHEKPRLYMFCRESREYPCLFLLKKGDGELLRRESGELWSQPSLALSRFGLDYNQIKGQTPQGVYRIDGVMPYADNRKEFGQFRRLILNFVGESSDEKNLRLLLPELHKNLSWWNESVEARDMGRSALRIHGTGTRSEEGATYFPFYPTSGCIAQRENTYGDTTYQDQRLLLDELMRTSDLEPVFGNEGLIRALLYVYELDDKPAPVALKDLKKFGVN